ncbi:N-acetylglucosamine kinase [Streptantibioticus silvisoli]|uniref:BadF/BadG/BcrA/BcrD ATPase family protein n=1 Tax=Streptantibioticus silvisoli TaxID=2705255 RepID=A0ABT6W620_9ACTN|nr:BadF/BadG/BcrA/BcrD ATPase family protein [Streptantibioticus silvisoli]MDI5966194.1 BadF/BadG/BcrA/BcrD ATPase family protein [Streptantibioticus silvisoli]
MLAVDSGGSGLRCALARAGGGTAVAERTSREPVRTGPGGIDAEHLLGQLLPAVGELLKETGADEVGAACVGAAGMATLGGELRERLPAALREAFGVRRLALAADAVTAYAGALGVRPGVVVAAGTGLIALGTDAGTGWRRVDGWGHLLGDCGSGAWIGRAGLEAAMRAHDGRPGGSGALLERLEAVFGPAAGMPGRLYPRTDRAAVLASFAPQVARCAAGGDAVADRVLREAAGHLLAAAAAARTGPAGGDVAFTGGLLKLGEPLLGPLREQAPELLPGARLVAPEGDPLHGAVRIAVSLACDGPALPSDPALLTVH